MIFRKTIPQIIATLLLLLSFYSCKKREEIIIKDNKKEINSLIKRGETYYKEVKYDSAFLCFNKVKSICNPRYNLREYIYSITYLTSIAQINGDYTNCESIATEAIPHIKNAKNQNFKWRIYLILATNYIYLSDFNSSKYYYDKSLNLKIDSERKLCSLINMANLYIQKKDYNEALKILESLKSKKGIINDLESYSVVLNNLGYCYFKTKKTKAIDLLNKALEIRLTNKNVFMDDWGLTANYLYLYEYYHDNKNNNEAVKYAKLLNRTARKINNIDDRLLALSLLIKNSTGEELKKHSLNYVHLNDSITKVRQRAKNYFAKLKYDSKKEKEENLKLKAEKELQQELEKNKNIIIIFTIVIIIIVSGFIYYYLIEKNKKEKIQTAYHTEIRIAKKLHDELANDIYQTIAFAETQDLSTPNNTEKLLDNLDSIYATTRNISRENNLIETGSLFSSNLKEMISGFGNHSINLMINGLNEIDWTSIENFKKITIYRVLQELLVNMKKHSQCSLVIVSFKKQENNLHLNYFDNGIGINLDKKIKKNGLQNVESRIIAINGTITFDSKVNNGVKINMTIPI